MRRMDDNVMSRLLSNFVRISVNVQNTFMTADELLHKFDVFRNSDMRADRNLFQSTLEIKCHWRRYDQYFQSYKP